ncbi:MAG: PolC-type DNA polymerase III [Lachnospiraceae bacterium]
MIDSFVALDLETTGVAPASDRIIEIGAIKVINGIETGRFSTFVNPRMVIPDRITDITGIDKSMVKDAPVIDEVLEDLMSFCEGLPLLGHNIIFDYSFLKTACVNRGYQFEKDGIDTLKLARKFLPDLPSKRLGELCKYFAIDSGHSHRAYDDARSAWKLYEKLCEQNSENAEFDKVIKLEYSIKKKSPITPAQIKYLNGLIKKHHIVPDVEIESLTKNDASRLIDRILSSYGREV